MLSAQGRELAPGLHRVEAPLGERFVACYLVVGDDATVLFDTGIDLRFHNYWDVIPREFAEKVLDTGQYPGHAGEFETSFALYAFPENVRLKAAPHSKDRGVDAATAEKGKLLAEFAIDGVAKLAREMLAN